MPKFFIKNNQIENNNICIIGEDVKHIEKVLRLNINDEINVCNTEKQENYKTKIMAMDKDKIICKIEDIIRSVAESNVEITVFQGLPKSEKMELIIQKCVELGAKGIVPVEMERSIVKYTEKDKLKKIERWQKISESAAKQCGRDYVPQINNIININLVSNLIDKYDTLLVAYENEQNNTLKGELAKLKNLDKKNLRVGVLIGPEGGLSQEEIDILMEKGSKIITLGKRILRTETVAMIMTGIIMYELEN